MINQINPRLAMVTHLSYDEELSPRRCRAFACTAAACSCSARPTWSSSTSPRMRSGSARRRCPRPARWRTPTPQRCRRLVDRSPANLEVRFPNPRLHARRIQEQVAARREIDPKKYYPPDVARQPLPDFPKGFKMDVREVAPKKLRAAQAKLTAEKRS